MSLTRWIFLVLVVAACGDDDDIMVLPDAEEMDTAPPLPCEEKCTDAMTFEACDPEPATVACEEGTMCGPHPVTSVLGCQPIDLCAAVGPAGRCDDDVLVTCAPAATEPTMTDCATINQVCAYVDDATGYGCQDPVGLDPFVVHGVVRYEDRPVVGASLGDPVAVPSRGVLVSVRADADATLLASGVTSDDGSFRLRYEAPAGGGDVYIQAVTTSPRAGRPVAVRRANNQLHGVGGTAFAPAAEVEADLLVPVSSGVAQAFNVFDVMVRGMDFARDALGIAEPSPLTAEWEQNSSGTYYLDGPNVMMLLGESIDDDGFDDSVILHELGHYWEDEFSRSDNPGGEHDGSPADPNLAWSEGFSTYLSGAVRGSPLYADTKVGGGWEFDMDEHVYPANPALSMNQLVSEDMVSEILWDAGAASTHVEVVEVGPSFVMPGWIDRGVNGVDLVDWLDAFLTANPALCGTLAEVVTVVRKFPYDFAPCQ